VDLSDLEEAIRREVDLLCKKENHSTLGIIRHTAFIGIARNMNGAQDQEKYPTSDSSFKTKRDINLNIPRTRI
jgi:hypothetical protein